MKFNFSEINPQYTSKINTDSIAAIARENANAANSDANSVYEACGMDIDGAILSISDSGASRINAMLNRSIQLSTHAASTTLSPSDRQAVTEQINYIRIELDDLQNEDIDQMIADKAKNIINYASESIRTQNSNRESVLQLL